MKIHAFGVVITESDYSRRVQRRPRRETCAQGGVNFERVLSNKAATEHNELTESQEDSQSKLHKQLLQAT